jgi:Prokaryotic N-terminal methylation motif
MTPISNRARVRQSGGFTLIELVASAVLTAILMTALLNVVWSAARESRQLRQAAISQFPTSLLVERLRVDFQNARGMAIEPSGITLHGFLSASTLLPGQVRYEIRRAGDRQLLMRTVAGRPSEPVWLGIASFQVESLETVDADSVLLAEPETGSLPPIPARLRVTMLGDRNQVLWREVIHHHES